MIFTLHNCNKKSEMKSEHSQYKKITFHVIPKVLPDSAIVYITGTDSLLGYCHPGKVPLKKYRDGSWRKTFTFKQGTEPIEEPLNWLRKSVKNYNINLGLDDIGQTFSIRKQHLTL